LLFSIAEVLKEKESVQECLNAARKQFQFYLEKHKYPDTEAKLLKKIAILIVMPKYLSMDIIKIDKVLVIVSNFDSRVTMYACILLLHIHP